MPANYNRFWELHITGPSGYYDFAPSINDQRDYQIATHGDRLFDGCMLVIPTNAPGIIQSLPIPPQGLPEQGYVASTLSILDMATCTQSQDFQQLVAWINDAGHLGKMRVNAHGNGMGEIGMSDGAAPLPVIYRDASLLVKWMVANSLAQAIGVHRIPSLAGKKNSGGLVTVNLAVCMGGRYRKSPATLNPAQTNSIPALNSAASRIATKFTQKGLEGIEITASNEITLDGASGVPGQWGRTFGIQGEQTPSMRRAGMDTFESFDIDKQNNGLQIDVPAGWTVRAEGTVGGYIRPPAGFDTWTTGTTPSAGATITNAQGAVVAVPPGWIVDRRNRKIIAPLGFRCLSYGDGLGGRLESIPENAPFTGLGQRMAHSIAKIRVIS